MGPTTLKLAALLAAAAANVGDGASRFRASVRQAAVGLGDAAVVEIDSSTFVPTVNGTVVWPFVNGSQFGAFATCAVLGRSSANCSLLLPLPYAGAAAIQLAVFPEGREWGGREGAWASGQEGACNQTAGCVYVVGQTGSARTILKGNLLISMYETPKFAQSQAAVRCKKRALQLIVC